MYERQGVVALCPNFDPPPPNGGDGPQTNTDPPNTKTTSIEEPPTMITTTTSQDTTKPLPPQVTETTTRWEISSLQITIFGTGTEGTITADPTDPPTLTTSISSTSVEASSPENDINNIAGTGNSAGSRLNIPFENSLAQGLLAIVCIAIVL
ncbi:hypothetical protein FQN54_006603 [Arachnomyces sp. PD_36]|nr:hypothetical protein FQN54_006603 [Arachnomyces sp. PD_36]